MPRYILRWIEPYARKLERFDARDFDDALDYARAVTADLAANSVHTGDELTTFRYRIDSAAGQPLADLEVSVSVRVRLREG